MKSQTRLNLAEKKVDQIEKKIGKLKYDLFKARKSVKPKIFSDYSFLTSESKKTSLIELFGDKSELIVIHNMGVDCPYCTLWADGFNGYLSHFLSRAAFVIESPDAPKAQKAFMSRRAWKFEMVSSFGTAFRVLAGFVTPDGDPVPGVSTFSKNKKGEIFQISRSMFGPHDNFCPVWDIFDLLPGGSKGWGPQFKY